MEKFGQAILWILASFSLPLAIAVFADRLTTSSNAMRLDLIASSTNQAQFNCQTIIADPNPPLNVRSSPVVAPDNKLASLPNGTPLAIVDEQQGWLRINSPLQGWVYKELTVTTCTNPSMTPAAPTAREPRWQADEGPQLLAIATEQYQSGNITGALALLKSISPQSASYTAAQLFVRQWQQDWSKAESEYYVAQKALRDERWQDVLQQVNGYPDIRYWREKLTPIVQQALKAQQAKGNVGNRK